MVTLLLAGTVNSWAPESVVCWWVPWTSWREPASASGGPVQLMVPDTAKVMVVGVVVAVAAATASGNVHRVVEHSPCAVGDSEFTVKAPT